MKHKVIDLTLLNIEDHGSQVLVNYSETYDDGTRKNRRKNIRDLNGPPSMFSPKTIVAGECWGKVYCGIIKSDVRILFSLRFQDGSAQLIQSREGSKDSLKLLQLCEDTASGHVPPSAGFAKPHQLGKNELPQGEYLIGRDIPAGIYDFFVVYGFGGKFDIAKYDADGKIIDGTWSFYWVGLKEEYEQRELIHVQCKEGYTIKIKGNVILKIAKAQRVTIDL